MESAAQVEAPPVEAPPAEAPAAELLPAVETSLAELPPPQVDPFAVAEEQAAAEAAAAVAAAAVSAGLAGAGPGLLFEGITDEFRLSGRLLGEGSLAEILGRGQSVAIAEASWGPVDGSAPMTAVPGIRRVDPDDFLVVLEPANSTTALPPAAGAWDVVLDLGDVAVVGLVSMPEGGEPGDLLVDDGDRFIAIAQAYLTAGGRALTPEPTDAFVNRSRVRTVRAAPPA